MLLGGTLTGTYALMAMDTSTITVMATKNSEISAEWHDEDNSTGWSWAGGGGWWHI